jgi:hypothetical protein
MDEDLAIRKTGRKPSCECGTCKKCVWRVYMRSYYQSKTPGERRRIFVIGRNPERVAAHDKARANTDERRASLRRSELRNPEKVKARNIASNHIRRGTMTKQPCVICGKEKVEAHHPDYSKPLEVIWYCRLHHVAAHRGGQL